MRQLTEKWINDFVSHSPEVEHKGKKVRPETRVSIPIGKVDSIAEVGKSNSNFKATVKVSGAKYPFSGFLNDGPVVKLLKEAKENDSVVCARFERKRKKDIDPTLSIMEITKDTTVARDNIIWVLSGVYNYGSHEWILTDDAASNPDDDPESVLDEIKGAVEKSVEGFFESDAPKLQTSDKDWKANHLISLYNYAMEHNKENEIGLNSAQVKVLANFMLATCDKLQMKANEIEAPNYNDYSHTKARGMLFSWMRLNPLTKELMGTKGEFAKWDARALAENLDIWNWAKGEAEKE